MSSSGSVTLSSCKAMYHLHPFSIPRLFSRSLALVAVTGLLATCCCAAEAPNSIGETTITSRNASADVPPTGTVNPILQELARASDPEQVEQLFAERRRVRITSLGKPPVPPAVEAPGGNEIDRFIVDRWRAVELPESSRPPGLCDDATFLRRVYLDLIGVVPTIDEATKFLADTTPDKRPRLVEQLLSRDEDYADHWTAFWQEAIGSAISEEIGGIPTRGNYHNFLHNSFMTNKPFDLMVAELITPRLLGHQPVKMLEILDGQQTIQIGFVQNDTHQRTLQTAAVVGQVFLGTSMKCASCHNHFLNDKWSQARFLGFAGLFAEDDLEQIRCEERSGKIIPSRFAFDIPGAPQAIPDDPVARLHLAAILVTDPHNPRFAAAIVNRLWSRYLGRGLYEPVDDYRVDVPASHPELLEWLAHDFMTHGFDLKRTIRLILNSRTFQNQYDPQLVDAFDASRPGEPRYYRSPTLRKLTAEQLIDSIRVVTTQKLEAGQREYVNRETTALRRALGKPSERIEISTSRSEDVAVVQALELINGDEYRELVYGSRLVIELAADELDPQAIAEKLFLATRGRRPSPSEMELATGFLEKYSLDESAESQFSPITEIPLQETPLSATDSRTQAVGDLSWALMTSPEFQFIQ